VASNPSRYYPLYYPLLEVIAFFGIRFSAAWNRERLNFLSGPLWMASSTQRCARLVDERFTFDTASCSSDFLFDETPAISEILAQLRRVANVTNTHNAGW
jgi:hypothetical protein